MGIAGSGVPSSASLAGLVANGGANGGVGGGGRAEYFPNGVGMGGVGGVGAGGGVGVGVHFAAQYTYASELDDPAHQPPPAPLKSTLLVGPVEKPWMEPVPRRWWNWGGGGSDGGVRKGKDGKVMLRVKKERRSSMSWWITVVSRASLKKALSFLPGVFLLNFVPASSWFWCFPRLSCHVF